MILLSPKAQGHPGAQPDADGIGLAVSNSSSLQPIALRIPEVIDLDTDSDTNVTAHTQKKPLSTSRLGWREQSTDYVAPSFILPPEVKPIRFDTESPRPSPAYPGKSKTLQTSAYSHNVPIEDPLVEFPPTPSIAVVKSDVQLSRTPLADLDRVPFTQQQQQTTATTSPTKAGIRVDVPLTPSQLASRRREILTKLKQSVDFSKNNPDEVNEIFGSSGFSKVYDTSSHAKLFRKAAQKKRKNRIEPDSLMLDFGKLNLASASVTAIDKSRTRHPRKQARDILNERFKQQTYSAPLTFENRLNTRQLDGKFQFVDRYVLSKKIQKKKQQSFHPMRHCQCLDNQCNTDCACFRHVIDSDDDDGDQQRKRLESIQIYRRRQDGLVVLTDDFINHWHKTIDIFECGQSCTCSSECVNRVAQKGRTVPLQIFETRKCGFGVRSTKNIVEGQFIDVYLGEVLTDEEVSKREAAAEEDTPSYVMTLDNFITDPQAMFHVDGANYGSVMRFVNHSCNPNCKTYTVVMSGGSKHLYHVGFYAIKDIKAGTELTIDYDPLATTEEIDEVERLELGDEIVRCQCGEPNCRKRLWAKGKEKRARRKRLANTHDD